jgi:uncharacterized membrane protein HdeD (DUF308 family)
MSQIPPSEQARLRAAQYKVSSKLGEVWWAFMLRGLMAAALGLLALFLPTASVALLLRLAGLFLIVDGLTALFSLRRAGEAQRGLAQGGLTALIGAVLLLLPETSLRLAFTLLGLWVLLTGASQLWAGWQLAREDPERSMAMAIGWLGTAGGLALLLWPGSGLIAIGWLIALAAFVVAFMMFGLAMRLKQAKGLVDEPRHPKP